MTRIGHLSDFHLLEDEHARRRGMARVRLRLLSAARALDARGRRERVRAALAEARAAEVDHLVITGDLTEDGSAAQFEVLAELLGGSGIPAERVTLIAGNHDVYAEAGGFAKAMAGPLRAYAACSEPGVVVELPGVKVTAVASAVAQHYLWAGGRIADAELARVGAMARHAGEHAVLVVTHHPWRVPRDAMTRAFRGLQNVQAARTLAREHPRLHVVHGHLHGRVDTAIERDGAARIFGAPAVVDAPRSPLRLYRCTDGRISPI